MDNTNLPREAVGASAGDDGSPSSNHFLAALSSDERRRILGLSERTEAAALTSLYEVGAPMAYCYFPERGVVSLITRLDDGFESAFGLIGVEGVVGLGALAGCNLPAANAFVVQMPLSCWRIRSTLLRASITRSPEVLDRVLRFDQALKIQIAQTAACNRRHSVERRLARWLLMTRDRVVDDELPLTQESLSAMLGARRASVTLAAHRLRDSGVIRYHHGHINIRNRLRLEALACECYGLVRQYYRQALGWPYG